jgi:beta-ribofuranosylaminobenzene 5'-phosphate synthase
VKVTIKTPARLHLGLVDMNGGLGRLFGGLGVGIDNPNVVVEAQTASYLKITGKEQQKATQVVDQFFSNYNVQKKVHLNVAEVIPCHVGLGSGTQFSIAIAVALAKVLEVEASISELAIAVGRAKRTSVGTSIFQHGGFVVDGGKNIKTQTLPPLIYRQPFPKEWRFIVAIPNQQRGLSNSAENHAFEKLRPQSSKDVGEISRLIMYKLLPSIAEYDIESFGEALTKIQVIIGNQFAQAQGGTYASQACADLIEFMRQAGAYGVGQTSWGPALYGVAKQKEAKALLSKVQVYLKSGVGGDVFIAKANNKGASIKVEA